MHINTTHIRFTGRHFRAIDMR